MHGARDRELQRDELDAVDARLVRVRVRVRVGVGVRLRLRLRLRVRVETHFGGVVGQEHEVGDARDAVEHTRQQQRVLG